MVAKPVIGLFEKGAPFTVPEHEPPLSVPVSVAGCGVSVIGGFHCAWICTLVQLTKNVLVCAAYDGAASTPAMRIAAPSGASRAMRIPLLPPRKSPKRFIRGQTVAA